MADEVRAKLYAAITEIVKGSFTRYGQEFPERVGDDRNVDAIQWSLRGLNRLFRLLDRYEFTERTPPKDGSP